MRKAQANDVETNDSMMCVGCCGDGVIAVDDDDDNGAVTADEPNGLGLTNNGFGLTRLTMNRLSVNILVDGTNKVVIVERISITTSSSKDATVESTGFLLTLLLLVLLSSIILPFDMADGLTFVVVGIASDMKS